MHSEEIEITILPDGRLEYTIKGVKGPRCDSISEMLEQIGRVTASERTGDYYDRTQETAVQVGLDE